jgi:hypothetical protein
VTTQGVLVFTKGENTTYFRGVFSSNSINLYRTESTICGFSKLQRFLLYRSNGEFVSCPDRCIPSAQARVGFQCIAGHILPSDGRVSFSGILVSNFQHRREQNFLGFVSARETKFDSLLFMRAPFWKVRAWADLTVWHAFVTKYRLCHHQHLQPYYLNQHCMKAYIWPNLKISEKFIFTVQIYVCSNKPRSGKRLSCVSSFDVLLPSTPVQTNIDINIQPRTVRIPACSSNHFRVFSSIPEVLSRCLARGDSAEIHLAVNKKFHFSN